MERLIETAMKATLLFGMACAAVCFTSLIVWAVRCIIRSIVETRFAFKVRYYIEDTHKRISNYDMRIRTLEAGMFELRAWAKAFAKETQEDKNEVKPWED